MYTLSIPCVYLVCSGINKVYLCYTYFILMLYLNRQADITGVLSHLEGILELDIIITSDIFFLQKSACSDFKQLEQYILIFANR